MTYDPDYTCFTSVYPLDLWIRSSFRQSTWTAIVQKQAIKVLLAFLRIMLRRCSLHNNNWFELVIKKWRIVLKILIFLFERFRDFQSYHRLRSIQDLIEVFIFRATNEDIQESLSNLFCGKQCMFCGKWYNAVRALRKNMVDRSL